MFLLQRFIDYVNKQHLFQKKDLLLIAVSGGIDSVVLCELCRQAGFHFEIAHCNFQLRGEESERDEKFVRALADKYQVKVWVEKFETARYAEKNKISIQVAARELRYEWFSELVSSGQKAGSSEPSAMSSEPSTMSNEPSAMSNKQKAISSKLTAHTTLLLSAHHANDNIETLLMNFFKGTGISGLHGILPENGKIIRPLLFAKREEIVAFARENDLSFVEDSSNTSDKYTRNYFRHGLIPEVKKVFPGVEENLIHNIERFREIEELYQQSVQLHKKKLLEQKGNEIHIPVLKLLLAHPLKTIVYEIIKECGFTAHQTDEVLRLAKSETGKYITSATYIIIKNRNWLIISPVDTSESHHIMINQDDKEIDFELGKLTIKERGYAAEASGEAPLPFSTSDHIATLDSHDIIFPLLLRKWETGDYFYPLGMQKKKKLSKFFIDEKMSLTEKERIWVIESNKKILWIIGKRIDDRFKVTGNTKNIYQLSLVP